MRAPPGSVSQDMQTMVLLGALAPGVSQKPKRGRNGRGRTWAAMPSLPNPKTAPKLSAAKNL